MKLVSLVLLLSLACTGLSQKTVNFTTTNILYGNKMYPNGTYARLRGVNVIAKFLPSQTPWLEDLYNYLESTKYIKRHYSVLPFNSIHMTVHPLFTEYEIPDRFKFGYKDWNDIIMPLTDEMLSFIMNYLEKHPLVLHPTYGLVHPSTAILTVSLNLPKREVESVSLLWKALRERFPDNDNPFGLIKDVFGLDPASGTYGFHFTIGYFYNRREFSKNVGGLIKELEELDSFFTNNFVEPITLDEARLHWFDSMTDFKPIKWTNDKKDSLELFNRTLGVSYNANNGFDLLYNLNYTQIWGMSILIFVIVVVIYLFATKRNKGFRKNTEYLV